MRRTATGTLPRSDLPEIVSTPILLGERAALAAQLFQLELGEWRSREDIEAAQREQLTILLAHHAAREPWLAEGLAAAGLAGKPIASADDLRRLPSLTRVRLQDSFRPHPPPLPPGHGTCRLHNTSGSTGEPVRVWRTGVSRLLWLANTLRFHRWAGMPFTTRLAGIRANQSQFGERPNWGEMVTMLFPSGPALMIDIETDIGEQLDKLAAFRPDSVLIYPSNLAALFDRMDETGIGLPSVTCWRTIGETLSPELVAEAQARGTRVHDCYSTEEIGYLAIACPDQPDIYHVTAETVLLEIVRPDGSPCAPGETGRVLVTDLTNFATPLIRYEMGDHAEACGPCPCGRGLPTLRRIVGRERNMIVKPDGTRHWPLTGYKQFRDIAPIRQYQMRQIAVDSIEMRLVTERPLTVDEERDFIAHLQAKLRYPFSVRLHYFEGRLPLGRNGKFEEFIRLF